MRPGFFSTLTGIGFSPPVSFAFGAALGMLPLAMPAWARAFAAASAFASSAADFTSSLELAPILITERLSEFVWMVTPNTKRTMSSQMLLSMSSNMSKPSLA